MVYAAASKVAAFGHTGSSPVGATQRACGEMEYAPDLGSGVERRGGSNPLRPTIASVTQWQSVRLLTGMPQVQALPDAPREERSERTTRQPIAIDGTKMANGVQDGVAT